MLTEPNHKSPSPLDVTVVVTVNVPRASRPDVRRLVKADSEVAVEFRPALAELCLSAEASKTRKAGIVHAETESFYEVVFDLGDLPYSTFRLIETHSPIVQIDPTGEYIYLLFRI